MSVVNMCRKAYTIDIKAIIEMYEMDLID